MARFTAVNPVTGFSEGLRYPGMNLLAGLVKVAGDGGLDQWFQSRGVTGLALRPPENLLPGAAAPVPVRIPALRRLVKAAFAKLWPRT